MDSQCGADRPCSAAGFGPRGLGLGTITVHGAATSWDPIGQGGFLTPVQWFSLVGGPSSSTSGVAMSTGPMSTVVARAGSSSALPPLSFPLGFSPRSRFAATAQASMPLISGICSRASAIDKWHLAKSLCTEDLDMLVIPRKFVQVMNEWLVIRRLTRVVRLSANKWCEFWVQVQNFEGHMVGL
ncbi:hypothetical protein D1007_43181 [Hordeum vulgare]|nr:hypothetical protein D1007_43181 [Hordeum vulgare]